MCEYARAYVCLGVCLCVGECLWYVFHKCSFERRDESDRVRLRQLTSIKLEQSSLMLLSRRTCGQAYIVRITNDGASSRFSEDERNITQLAHTVDDSVVSSKS